MLLAPESRSTHPPSCAPCPRATAVACRCSPAKYKVVLARVHVERTSGCAAMPRYEMNPGVLSTVHFVDSSATMLERQTHCRSTPAPWAREPLPSPPAHTPTTTPSAQSRVGSRPPAPLYADARRLGRRATCQPVVRMRSGVRGKQAAHACTLAKHLGGTQPVRLDEDLVPELARQCGTHARRTEGSGIET